MGRALEAALAALAEYDRSHGAKDSGAKDSGAKDSGAKDSGAKDSGAKDSGAKDAARARLVGDASDALWCFMVQREAFGLRDPRPVIRDYRVPAEVHNRMGAFGRR